MPESLPANRSPEQLKKIQCDPLDPGTSPGKTGPGENSPQTISLDICLGTTRLKPEDADLLCVDQLAIMDQQAGGPVQVFAAGKPLAEGILVILNGKFGVRITGLPDPANSPG
ncbi:MAG: FliM/FliN family flagellar motor switch protein [Pirellulaceae bacterium]|jgi:flagellar motor switch/type III secretory pathway protein FliN|nr:FliM/FliN family flagellar motor switch protein [Pirellulaceae bacterium]